jgi:membrane protein DedA with SNARE-associated domain
MDTQLLLLRLEELFQQWGYLLVFISSFVETSPIGWTIPGGFILAIGGFFSFEGHVNLFGVLIAGWLGQWLTFLLAYYFGLRSSYYLIKKFRQEKNAYKAKVLLEKHGGVILTTSMLANLTRFWVAYVAGIQSYNVIKFLFYSAAASLTWTSFMVMVGYIAGVQRHTLENAFAGLGIISWLFVGLALLIIYLKTKRGYRQFSQK